MIKCTECGYENMDGLDYCDGCGAKLAAAAPARLPAAPAAPAPEAPRGRGSALPARCAAARRLRQPKLLRRRHLRPRYRNPTRRPASSTSPLRRLHRHADPRLSSAPSRRSSSWCAAAARVRSSRSRTATTSSGDGIRKPARSPRSTSMPTIRKRRSRASTRLTRIESGKITVEDIGSLNGTYVNRGQRLQPGSPADIKNGDEVIIGKTFLKLVVEPIA